MPAIHVPYGIKGKINFEIPPENLVLDTDVPFPSELVNLDQAILDTLAACRTCRPIRHEARLSE
jgi:hypothetical protein